jgi:hypothetical protein
MNSVKESALHPKSDYFDLKLAALGTWLLGGIYMDGWAHNHIHVETFFTPWHAVLYSGFLANAAFWAQAVIRARRKGKSWGDAVPRGYGLALLGTVIFGISGICDLIWHSIFGIEVSVSAGFSPPHLGIMAGTGLIITGPFVSAWKRAKPPEGWTEWLPILMSLTLGLSLMTFVFQYASPLVVVSASVKPLKFHDLALGAISILLQTLVLMGWILTAIKRWTLPRGSTALVIILNGVAMTLMRDRYFLIPAIALAGIGAELLSWKQVPSPTHRQQFYLFAFAVPTFYYLCYFAVVWMREGITWPIPLWTGATVMSGMLSALLSFLILPAPYPKSVEQRMHQAG